MNKKYYVYLSLISAILIVLLDDGMLKHFSLFYYSQSFIFISVPFILASIFGWKKGFLLSTAISFILVSVILYDNNYRDPFISIYTLLFGSFSIMYLLISFAIHYFMNKKS